MNTMKRNLLGFSVVALLGLGLGLGVNAEEMMDGMKSSKEMMGTETMEKGTMQGKEMVEEKKMMKEGGAMHEADMGDQKKMDMDKGMEKEGDMKKGMMEKKVKRPM